MASKLTVEAVWHDELTIIDPDDPVQGGDDGIDNQPHIELAQNDRWLKTELAKALERITALESKGTTTVGTGGTTTPTNPTGVWSFLYAICNPDFYKSKPNVPDFVKYTTKPIYWYMYELWFETDLPKVIRMPYEKYSKTQPQYTADKYTNRVLIYVAKPGEQPDYTELPMRPTFNNANPLKLDASYFIVTKTGKIYLEDTTASSGREQAARIGVIDGSQETPGQLWDTYYIFLLDEKADAKLSDSDIAAQNWGNYHIEKVTMSTVWDDRVGAYTEVSYTVAPPDTSAGGNIAAIEA